MAKTYPQRYWRQFEGLAFELARDQWDIEPTKIWQTKESKDGGFDGGILHELARVGNVSITHETLMEAKLRAKASSVGLRTFAATMVIAFNGRTNCLIVVSNGHYSQQALEVARDFDSRSRIRMILVDGASVSAWVRPRLQMLAERYDEAFLSELVFPDPADERAHEQQIKAGGMSGMEPSARIECGRRDDGTLAPCEVIVDRPEDQLQTIVIGEGRRELVEEIAAVIATSSGCAIVLGESGVGKSHVVRGAIETLRSHIHCLGLIDLAQTATSRQLFIAIVAHIIGVHISDVARDLTKPKAATILRTAGGQQIPGDVLDAVISVLTSGRTVDDVNQIHLCDYLGRISNPGKGNRRLIAFHNLNQAPAEVLEFLSSIVPVLDANGISTLLEVTDGGDAPLIAFEKWRHYIELFKRVAALGCFRVDALDPESAVDLLLNFLPGLGRARAEVIRERVGNKPLFLRSAALWLRQRRIVLERAQGVSLIEEPETFFEGLRPEAAVAVLDRHIDLWRQEHTDRRPYADVISAATLLQGRIPVDAVSLLMPPGADVDTMLDDLAGTGLFSAEPGLKAIRVVHPLLLERMDLTDGAYRFRRKSVADKLIAGIDSYTSTGVVRDLFLGALFCAREEWELAWTTTHIVAQALAAENQLGAAAEAFASALTAAERALAAGDTRASAWRVYSLLELLKVEDERYRLGLDENLRRLKILTTAVRTTDITDIAAVEQRVLYLSWRAEFTREHLDRALDIARQLHAGAFANVALDSEDVGRAVAALGITLKTLEQEQESKQVFDEGLRRFPASNVCRVERWSNLAAFALRADPKQALAYYRRIISETGDLLRIDKRLHVEVDLAMAYFLMGSSHEAVEQSIYAIRLADTNGLPAQAARARNILGCTYWLGERVESAFSLFDRAALDAERSYMRRFLWRIRVNLAASGAEAGHPAEAIANARSARDLLIRPRQSRWAELAASPQHLTSRWYVALLRIGLVFLQCEQVADYENLLSDVKLPYFERHLTELASGRFSPEVFAGTTNRFGERIMITG